MTPLSPHVRLKVHACRVCTLNAHINLTTVLQQAGDGLLLEASPDFLKRHAGGSIHFTVVSPVQGATWRSVLPPERPRHAALAAVLLLATVTVAASGLLELGTVVLVTNFIFVLCRTVSVGDALRAVSLRTLITVSCALGLGKALVGVPC